MDSAERPSRIRLRMPSPSPPPRIRLKTVSADDPDEQITTPHRRKRNSSLRHHPTSRPKKTANVSPKSLYKHWTGSSHTNPMGGQGYQLNNLPPITPAQGCSAIVVDVQQQVSHSPLAVFSPSFEISTPRNTSGANFDNDNARPYPTLEPIVQEVMPEDLLDIQALELYQSFVEAVLCQICAIYQLSQRLFVVNGWNSSTRSATTHWYHLARTNLGGTTQIVCMCPSGKSTGRCFHARFMAEYESEQFPPQPELPVAEDKSLLITRYQEVEDDVYSNMFSIPALHNPTIRNRSVVQFLGKDDGTGKWTCNRHTRAMSCAHISNARHCFQKLLTRDDTAVDYAATSDMSEPDFHAPPVRQAGAKLTDSVSYVSRHVPIWARVSSDDIAPAITNPQAIESILLDPLASSCFCKADRISFDPFIATEKHTCTIYGLSSAQTSDILLQKCTSCKLRFVGPDCHHLGLFNWNNRVLFTHQLLDDYTCAFTTSETPFSAWVTVVSRRYPTDTPFVSERLFRAAWFSYVRLINFEGNQSCSECGPTPDAIIFDGVSLAFNRKNVLSTLRPPTTTHNDSAVRERVLRRKGLQLIPDKSLRKRIRKILIGPSLVPQKTSQAEIPVNISTLNLDGDDTQESGSSNDEAIRQRNNTIRAAINLKRKKALLERVCLIPQVVQDLKNIDVSLGDLFEKSFGVLAIMTDNMAHTVYQKLFLQICAEESALQMMNNQALQKLLAFIKARDQHSASNLVLIPALYNVIHHELATHQKIHDNTYGVSRWLYFVGESVRKTLLVYKTEEPSTAIKDEHPWRVTGCYYEMPQIRHRPQYPSLKEDKRDIGQETKGGCRKFFSTYSPLKLTGGIMVAWCTHSVSYGFHCIPVAEGRNDVFLALYTRWEKAPSIIVYDFACALQPYCMLREPEFFQDTLFVIDAFHAPDHTKCCASSFLTTYSDTDPHLVRLNSSAGECGNGGLGRIRKSISYMGQDRAVVYCMVFLSIWNRHRIRKMEKDRVMYK